MSPMAKREGLHQPIHAGFGRHLEGARAFQFKSLSIGVIGGIRGFNSLFLVPLTTTRCQVQCCRNNKDRPSDLMNAVLARHARDRKPRRMSLRAADLARYIDHTLLKPEASAADIERLCAEALEHRFHAVCVNGSRVALAAARLEESGVYVAAVVGFPLGAADSDAKRFETESVIDLGAQEIDLVLNIGRLREGDDRYVLREMRDVVEAAQTVPVKVILETCLLNEEQKRRACSLAVEAGVRMVKTSTGFSTGGATLEDVRLMRECVGPKIGVKASGGIRDTATALAMIEAGATRLGTSSGVAILRGVATEGSGY